MFQSGRYQEALGILNELNQAFPNTRNVLYPAALCLEKLGRQQDAWNICEQLIAQFQDPRARQLQATIIQQNVAVDSPEPPPLLDSELTGASDILDMGPPRSVPVYTPVSSGSSWIKYTLYGVAAILLLAFIIIPPMMYEPPPELPSIERTTNQDVIATAGIGLSLLLIASLMAGNTAGSYVALKFMDKLPSDDLMGNLISVGGTVILVALAGIVPIIGFFIGLVIISKTYDLGCGGLIIFVVCGGVGGIIIGIVPIVMFISALGPLLQT